MPCTLEKRLPSARLPEASVRSFPIVITSAQRRAQVPAAASEPHPSCRLANEASVDGIITQNQLSSSTPKVMDRRASLLSDSLEESHRPSPPSATHLAKKPPPLRIIVPPTEYCPFSTDLILPITPPSLPTPVSSSCFTFSDTQEVVNQDVSVPPTPAPVQPSCSRDTAVADFASPTSSQFLLMPPTSHLQDADTRAAIRVLPLHTPAATDEDGSNGTKAVNPRSWEVSSSTWLSDLGGHTETDRIFRHNLLGITLSDTDSSPASTPALSLTALSPSSQVSSILAYSLPTSGFLTRLPVSFPPALSPYSCTMSSQSSSPARLVLRPTGTDTFPSTLDGLQVWREGVTPGVPQSEEPQSPFSDGVHASPLGDLMPETTTAYPSLPPRQPHPRYLSPRAPRVSKSKTFINRAKTLGGRVRQLVTRQSGNRPHGSMDRSVSFRIVTSQDSENGSVILITAPPPPYDIRPPSHVLHGPSGQEHARSRTASEYSSAVQTNTVELSTSGMTESGSRQGGGNRNALRRLSLATLSTIKRF